MAMKWLKRWRGGVAVGLLGASLLALFTAESELPARDEDKAAALPSDLAKVPGDALFVLSGRVADLWNNDLNRPVRQKLAKEIAEGTRAFEKKFGLSVDQVERMTLVALDVTGGEPLVFVYTSKPYDRDKVIAGEKTKEEKYKGQTFYVKGTEPAVYPLDERTLVYGTPAEIRAFIDRPAKSDANMAAALRLAAGKHSLVCALNVKAFNDAVGDKLPGETEPFKPLLQALFGTLTVDLGAESRADVKLTFAAEKDAKAALQPARTGLDLARAGMAHGLDELNKHKDMDQLIELLKQFEGALKAVEAKQEGQSLRASAHLKLDPAKTGLVLMEGVRKVRMAAARAQLQNNMKQIALGMHNYHDTMRRLPARATFDKNGKPMLSWRVTILPYIEQQNLYNQFHLNEPWDSEHNKKWLAVMPKTYMSPDDENTFKDHTTYFQALVGKGTIFEGKRGISFSDVTDGTSNTIMIVEASKAVPWTKPDDIVYDAAKPLPTFGRPGADTFEAAFCDGSVHVLKKTIKPMVLRNLITRDDGNIIDPKDF